VIRIALTLALVAAVLTGAGPVQAADGPNVIGTVFGGYPESVRVPGACVMATADGVTPLSSTCADAQGEFAMTVPRGVIFSVRASAPGYVAGWSFTGLDFASAQRYSVTDFHQTDVSIDLAPGDPGGIDLTLTNFSGAPLGDVTVRMRSDVWTATAQTGADGVAHATGLRPGSYQLSSGIFGGGTSVQSGQTAVVSWKPSRELGLVDIAPVDGRDGSPIQRLCAGIAASDGTVFQPMCGPDGVTTLVAVAGVRTFALEDNSGFEAPGVWGNNPEYYFKHDPFQVTVVAGQRVRAAVPLEPAGFLRLSAVNNVGEPTPTCFFLIPTRLPLGTVDLRYREEPVLCQPTEIRGPLPVGHVHVYAGRQWIGAGEGTGDQRAALEIPVPQGISVAPTAVLDYSVEAANRTVRGAAWDPALQRQVSVCAYTFAESPYLKWSDVWDSTCGVFPMLQQAGKYPIPVLVVAPGYASVWADNASSRAFARLIQPLQGTGGTFDVELRPAGRLEVVGGTDVTVFDAYTGDLVDPSALNTGKVYIRYRFEGHDCWYVPNSLRRFIPFANAQRVSAGEVTTLKASTSTCRLTPPSVVPAAYQIPPGRK